MQWASLFVLFTVKIVLMPSGQVVTMACTLGKTLLELKRHFASELKMSVDVIMMIFDGKMGNIDSYHPVHWQNSLIVYPQHFYIME